MFKIENAPDLFAINPDALSQLGLRHGLIAHSLINSQLDRGTRWCHNKALPALCLAGCWQWPSVIKIARQGYNKGILRAV